MIYDSIIDINNNDVFYFLDDFIRESSVFVKMENFNLAGSIKLKAAIAMIEHLEHRGIIGKEAKIVESSSGNLGVALAMICAAKGYEFTCVTDPNASPHNMELMKAYGARVIIAEHSQNGSFVKERLRIISELLNHNPNMVWTDQYSNPENPNIHYRVTAPAIHEQIRDIDYLFLGVGSSGTLMGCIKYFREHKPSVKIIAVDPDGSILFGEQIKQRYIPGIGGSVQPKLLDPSLVDDFVVVEEKDTLAMCGYMAKTRGWLIGGSTGSALQGIKQYASKLPKGSKVVTLAPDFGTNYIDTIYNEQWARDVGMHADMQSSAETVMGYEEVD